MNIGIVGTGMIAKELLSVLEDRKDISCTVLCGTERSAKVVQELCEKYGISKGMTDYEEFLQEQIDAVYLAVPNHLHFSFCKKALESGKNVIVEKPLAASEIESDELVKLAKERKLFLYEAITTRYLKNYKKVKELLPKIGRIRLVNCNFSQYSSRYDRFLAGERIPVFDAKQAGGVLMDLGVYNLHYVMGLFGEPEDFIYYADMENGVDTSGMAVLTYSDFHAVCIAAKNSKAPFSYCIQGTKGYISQQTPANSCGAVTLYLNDGTEEVYDFNENKHRMCAEFETFERQIYKKDYASCYQMLEESLAVSRVMTKLRWSAGIRWEWE